MKICKSCGKPITGWYAEQYPDSDKCFSCKLWEERKSEYLHPDKFVANGVMYSIGDENSKDQFRGFDGARVEITFLDGRPSVVSTNLWCMGDIPETFRDYYKDNAILKW